MERIKLSQAKLLEILKECDNSERMEFYYNAALNDQIEADQHMALVGLLLMLVRHYHTKLFVNTSIDPLCFFGLKNFNEQSEYWKFYELLKITNLEILLCLINNESIPQKPLIEFSEIVSFSLFCYGDYLKCLDYCKNALSRDAKDSICNFLKASIIDLCYINKTSPAYKIALTNYAKSLIDKCAPEKLGIDMSIYTNIKDEINHQFSLLESTERELNFSPVFENLEETKKSIPEWTEEHDFYLQNNLFLNPLSNFGRFAESSIEELEDLPIDQESMKLFSEIVNDYKFCRSIAFSYYKGINNVNKREMSMTYSYAYSIFDKIAFLLRKVYDLEISEDHVSYTKGSLFDAKIKGTDIKFGEIKNINIVSLYLIMKEVRTKQNITNALQIGTWEHNELRNTIDHKSIALVEEGKLKRNAAVLLEHARNSILYTFMLLHGYSKNLNYCVATTISTAFFRAILKTPQESIPNDER